MVEALQSSLSSSTCTSGRYNCCCLSNDIMYRTCIGRSGFFNNIMLHILHLLLCVSYLSGDILFFNIIHHNFSFFVSFMCVFVSVSLFSIDIYWILLVLKRIHKRNNAAHADFIFFCVHLSLCLHLCIYHCINLTISVTAVAAFLEYCWGF